MADTLPQNFPIPAESATANYDYTDLDEGTGIVHYYGARVSISSTAANDVYILTKNSSVISSSPTTGPSAALDLDFDVFFNLPKVIRGTMIVVMPIQQANSGSMTPSIIVRKWDGSTETQIVASTSAPALSTGGASVQDERTLKITIPETDFQSGETLRITFTATSSGDGYVAHEPSGSQSSWPDSGGAFSVYVPFKLDL